MENIKWMVGDWCLHEFTIKQIKRVDNIEKHTVNEVSDGYFTTSCGYNGFNDSIFPITLEGKVISEEFSNIKEKLRNYVGNINLNWPDIHRYFVKRWCACMNELSEPYDNKEKRAERIKMHYDIINEFSNKVSAKVEELQLTTINGVRLIRL